MSDTKTRHPKMTDEPMGAAGKETGAEEPSEMGTAGVYATTVHEEGEQAQEAGREKSKTR